MSPLLPPSTLSPLTQEGEAAGTGGSQPLGEKGVESLPQGLGIVPKPRDAHTRPRTALGTAWQSQVTAVWKVIALGV